MQPSLSMQNANLKPALPGALAGVGIDQKLDAQLPLNLTFRDEAGRLLNSVRTIGTLGGATIDNEENYLIKKLFGGGLGVVSIENQARI